MCACVCLCAAAAKEERQRKTEKKRDQEGEVKEEGIHQQQRLKSSFYYDLTYRGGPQSLDAHSQRQKNEEKNKNRMAKMKTSISAGNMNTANMSSLRWAHNANTRTRAHTYTECVLSARRKTLAFNSSYDSEEMFVVCSLACLLVNIRLHA